MIKTTNKCSLGKKGLFPLTICSQLSKEVRAGALRQELKHKPRGILLAGLLSLLSYTLKAHLPLPHVWWCCCGLSSSAFFIRYQGNVPPPCLQPSLMEVFSNELPSSQMTPAYIQLTELSRHVHEEAT